MLSELKYDLLANCNLKNIDNIFNLKLYITPLLPAVRQIYNNYTRQIKIHLIFINNL